MDTNSTNSQHKSDASEELDRTAEALEALAGQRDESRIEAERNEREDLNQGMQTGTHDALHTGIRWGSSYRIKESNSKK